MITRIYHGPKTSMNHSTNTRRWFEELNFELLPILPRVQGKTMSQNAKLRSDAHPSPSAGENLLRVNPPNWGLTSFPGYRGKLQSFQPIQNWIRFFPRVQGKTAKTAVSNLYMDSIPNYGDSTKPKIGLVAILRFFPGGKGRGILRTQF